MKRPEILVAEDDEHVRKWLGAYLPSRGYGVKLCADGLEALQLLRKAPREPFPYDALLADVRMPGATGLELLHYVKRRELPLPVVLSTAYAERDVLREALRLHCDGFVDKPCSGSELMKVLGEVLYHVPVEADGRETTRAFRQSELPRLTKYEILSEIGRGGMGVVYRARQRGLQRRVALKVLRGERLADPDALDRFRREARAMAHLQHPNVAIVHELGTERGVAYIAMELIEGTSLAGLLALRALEPWEAVRIAWPIATALRHCHEQGVLHRDVKPTNILIHESGRPVLVDFGIAQALQSPGSAEEEPFFLGTLGFMAPEYLSGQAYAPSCDVYAFGVVLYQCLAGSTRYPHWEGRPRVAGTRQFLALADKVCHEAPTPVAKWVPGLNPELARLVDSALAPVDERCSMAELADGLRRVLLARDPQRRGPVPPSPPRMASAG